MTPDIIFGCVVLFMALGLNAALALWGRRTIGKIADKQLGSARDIVQELDSKGDS
ncbi:hypothetical protein ACFLQU_02975 [Verrucomicrobiota bacterium]